MGDMRLVNLYARRSLRTYCSEVLVLILTAVFYSFAFPGFLSVNGLGFLAFFALIPIFAVIRNTTWKVIPFYGFLFGFSFYMCFNYWLKTFHPLAILIVPIIKGGEMLLLFPCLKAADGWFKRYGYLFQSFIWIAYAYLSQSWFAGYPYGTLGYAVYQYLPLIQIASLTGVWGVTFLMILPQTWFGAWLGDYAAGRCEGFGLYVKKNLVVIICYGVLAVASLVFGFCSMSYWNGQEPDRTWKVVTVQHNHDSWKGGYATYKKNFNNLRLLTLQALQRNPDVDMVIWSETAFVPSVAWHENYTSPDADIAKLVEEFVNFGKELPVPLLTGNPEGVLDDPSLPPVLENGEWNRTDYNTVIFFEDGEIKETYRKQHLVPFTEHFPYEKQMPWLYNLLLANDYNWWEKGTVPVVFRTEEGVTFSTPICFEDVFGYLTADFVRNGADVIVNMTNDSWSGAVSAEMQHLAMAVFRSVETRKTTVRGTNSGMTCVIAPDGKIIDPMEPFKMAWNVYDVPVYSSDTHELTMYAQHDDWFAWMMVYVSLALLVVGGGYQIFKAVRSRRDKVR